MNFAGTSSMKQDNFEIFAELKWDQYLGEDPFSNSCLMEKNQDDILHEMELGTAF